MRKRRRDRVDREPLLWKYNKVVFHQLSNGWQVILILASRSASSQALHIILHPQMGDMMVTLAVRGEEAVERRKEAKLAALGTTATSYGTWKIEPWKKVSWDRLSGIDFMLCCTFAWVIVQIMSSIAGRPVSSYFGARNPQQMTRLVVAT